MLHRLSAMGTMARTALWMTMAAVLLAGCARPTEEQRLAKFRGSMKYRTYRFASQKAVGVTVTEYNKRTKPAINDTLVHSTLGILWFLGERSEYSFIEADIAAAAATNDLRVLALGLQSIALSKMKCPRLARSRYDEIKTLLAAQQGTGTDKIETEHKAMLLGLIAVGLYHGDPDLARFGADALGAIGQLDYLPPLVAAVAEARKGSPLKAAAQLRELNKSGRFAEHKKALLDEMADILANSPADTMGEDFTNRVLVQLVWRVLDDVFSEEHQRLLLEKTKTLPDLIKGKPSPQPAERPTE